MDLKIRKVFFYCLIGVFVLLGAYLLATAQGWVLDLKNFKIVKTGSLYLRYSPTDAVITINGKVSNISPGILSSGVLISKLIPDDYRIKIGEPGYLPWEKTLAVGEALVASESQIKLWPEIWKFKEVATSSVSDFWLTGAGAILQFPDKTLHLDGNLLRGRQVVLSESNSTVLISSDGQNYFLTDLENPKIPLNLSTLFKTLMQSQSSSTTIVETPKQFFFHPFSNNKILITTGNALYSLDWKRESLSKLADIKNLAAAAASNNEIFLEDAKGGLIISNIFLQTSSVVETRFPTNSTMKASPGGSFAFFLDNNGGLEIYDRSSKATSTIFKNAADIFISSDERKLVLASKDGQLSLMALNDYYADGNVKKGDEWPILSSDAKIADFKWLNDNSNYGLVLSLPGQGGGKLSITELDRRTPQNIYLITDGVKKFFAQGNDLYILKSDGTLLETSLK